MSVQFRQILAIMKKIKWLLLILLVIYIINGLHTSYVRAKEIYQSKDVAVSPQNAPEQDFEAMSVSELIDYIAPQYGADKELIKKITWCESKHKALPHDRGLGFGVTGYHRKTFEYHKGLFGRSELKYESTFDQLTLMSIAFSKGEQYRNLWTTYVAYKNGGTYSFYSNTLQGHYTVKC